MRHQRYSSRFGRDTAHRKAMFRNLLISLFEHDKIRTTEAKAKTIRPFAERLITLAKNDTQAARRRAYQKLQNNAAVNRLFNELGPRYADRDGGYTRILKLGPRQGDCAPMAYIELV